MQKMAMIRTFKVVMKTHYIANGIFFPYICSIFGDTKILTIDVPQERTGGKKERKERKKKCLNVSKDKVKHHAGVLLGVFALNNAKTFRRCLLSLGACGRVKCDIT